MSAPLRVHWYLPTHGDTATIADNQATAGTRVPSYLESSLENLTTLARTAEDLGFEAALTPTGSFCEDSWLVTAALAQHTRALKFLVAFRPGVLSPTLAAQQVSTYQRFTGNRLALNVVTGGDDAEMRRFGDDVDKSARYRRTGEFLAIVQGVLSHAEFSFDGEFYTVERAKTGLSGHHPADRLLRRIVARGHRRAAEYARVSISTWGEDPRSRSPRSSSGSGAAAAEHGRTLRFGVRLPHGGPATAEQAWQRAEALLADLTPDQVALAHARYSASVSEGQRRMAALTDGVLRDARSLEIEPGLWAGPSLVRDGAGTAAVGSYADVAGVLGRYVEVGATEFILSGYPQIEEIRHVGDGVLPLLRIGSAA
ncbi:LLM class flavin-dependent oxidoreductase [Mycobacterium rufum]|uniref:LLM class flavin-dependent oxidoreductase n=1 Tax=Mycolicibacterium rufum TaxID=318424 RepID=A0A9X2YG30_9MYCO|nr:LLM class flavin-dependent oxidoreductase [Mycolicibacterium rufum]